MTATRRMTRRRDGPLRARHGGVCQMSQAVVRPGAPISSASSIEDLDDLAWRAGHFRGAGREGSARRIESVLHRAARGSPRRILRERYPQGLPRLWASSEPRWAPMSQGSGLCCAPLEGEHTGHFGCGLHTKEIKLSKKTSIQDTFSSSKAPRSSKSVPNFAK